MNLSLEGNVSSAIKVLRRARLVEAFSSQELRSAKGVVIMTALKGGFFWSGALGRGMLLKRQSDGSFSPPVALVIAQGGVGVQFGIQKEEFVLILSSDREVARFENFGSISLNADFGLAVGAVGANTKTGLGLNQKSIASHATFANSQGAYFGIAFEGAILVSNKQQNARFYGSLAASQRKILNGEVEVPAGRKREAVVKLHHALANIEKGFTIAANQQALEKKLKVANLPQAIPLDESGQSNDTGSVALARPLSFAFE